MAWLVFIFMILIFVSYLTHWLEHNQSTDVYNLNIYYILFIIAKFIHRIINIEKPLHVFHLWNNNRSIIVKRVETNRFYPRLGCQHISLSCIYYTCVMYVYIYSWLLFNIKTMARFIKPPTASAIYNSVGIKFTNSYFLKYYSRMKAFTKATSLQPLVEWLFLLVNVLFLYFSSEKSREEKKRSL